MALTQPLPRLLLAVGDDATGRDAERLLSSFDGLSVTTRVDSGEAALDALDGALDALDGASEGARAPEVDCLVVGDDLPDADLLALVESVDVPVVVLQVADAGPTSAALFDAGAADVVPVVDSNLFERLPERVASVVRWRRASADAQARITEDLKEQSMDEAPVGITIADFSLPDRPLVYVNDAFEAMTGYTRSEALGRNCRYLQGPGTDLDSVAELRAAVENETSASVELLNYRRDGSTFWNRVDIAPLRDESGEVTHYVGFQTDITERVRAEAAAERFAAEVDRERERLQRLLDHIEGLLQDVTQVLVRAESRTELEQGVCERVVATDSYDCAWVGDCDLSPEAVVPKEWAGETLPDVVGLRVDRRNPDDPVARAVTTLRPQTQVDPEGRFHSGSVVPFEGLTAVPLVHRDTLYGVLVVYGDRRVTDEQERVILGTLGRAMGAAIDAFETRRSLLTESQVELRLSATAPDSPLVTLAAEAECTLAYEGAVAREDGSLLLFVSADPPDADLATADVPGIERVRSLRRTDDNALYEVSLDPGSLLGLIPDAGGRLVDLAVDPVPGLLELTVVVPDRAGGRSLIDELESVTRGVSLHSIRDLDGPRTTQRGFVASVENDLTDRQQTALQLAYHGGFFEWPHGVSGDELAESMGISRATFHQHLRAAQRKLVSRFYQDVAN